MTSLYADVRAVRGALAVALTLDVADDATVAIVGPNGAGKTTALHAIAGLIPSHGEVVAPQPVGMVFQDRRLFPHLSALDNGAFGADRERARTWLARAGLAGKASSLPRDLSGGEAQRLALARTLAAGPRLLLLDEPFTALDVESREFVRREIETFAGPRVLVTHAPTDAASLAAEFVVLEAGAVVQRGGLATLAAHPKSRYVADFVGVNWLPGTADAGGVRLDGGGHLVAASEAASVPAGAAVAAIVHPRAVALYAAAPAGSPRNAIHGRVAEVDVAADRVRVTVDGPPPLVAEVTPAAAAELGLAPGREVWAVVKATEVTVTAR